MHYTPHYIYAPSVPYEVRQFYPNAKEMKFILLLRVLCKELFRLIGLRIVRNFKGPTKVRSNVTVVGK
jgi:hypothetical protein